MVDYIKKHKILTTIIVILIFLLTSFSFIMNYPTSEEVNNINSNPESLSNFVGYWKSGNVYFDINEDHSFISLIDNDDNSVLSTGTYIDQSYGGDLHFNDGFSWNCSCYKQDDNNAIFSYTATDDPEEKSITLERINENTFNEAKSKVETYLADKGITNNSGTAQTENTTSGYKSGTYKVGTDMPAGEYVLTSSKGSGYVSVSSDSSGELDSLIDNDNFGVQDYLIVNDGEYVTLGSGVTATPIDEAEVYSGTLSDGVFKVGRDLPAGEYQVSASGGSGYWARNYSGVGSSNDIIANNNFENSTYVTVEDGEYLQLGNHTILTR